MAYIGRVDAAVFSWKMSAAGPLANGCFPAIGMQRRSPANWF